MEYGGCLHFELLNNIEGEEYYHKYEKNKVDVDSGRSAIQFILEKFSFKRILSIFLTDKSSICTIKPSLLLYNYKY